MWYIPILFQVSDMEIHFISYTYTFYVIRGQVRSDSGHIDINPVTASHYLGGLLPHGYELVLISIDIIYLSALPFDLISSDPLCLVWLANCRIIP